MNTTRKISGFFIILLISILMNSCLDYEITTQIYPDGKLERIFKVSGDKDMIYESSSIKLPADSTWEIKTWMEPDTTSEKTTDSIYVYRARKVFRNYKELNKVLQVDPNVYDLIRIDVELKKRFRWFYSFFVYRETYREFFPYNYLPSDEFLTKDEIRYCLSNDEDYRYNPVTNKFVPLPEADTAKVLTKEEKAKAKELDKDIQNRFEQWQTKNIYEDYFNALSAVLAEKDQNANNRLIQHKQELYDSLRLGEVVDFVDSDKDMKEIKDFIISGTSKFLSIPHDMLQQSANTKLQEFFDRLGFLKINLWYKYHNTVIMPGILTKTNSISIAKNNSTWNFSIKDFYVSDYEMTVQSKVVNNWSVVISIIVVILLLAGLITGIIRR